MAWSAAQYVKFEDERNRPIRDLLAQVPTQDVMAAADIGCGPGNSTQLLREAYPQARIRGMDSSADMIGAARRRLPDIDFAVADIETWNPAQIFDLILANAVLQWTPDHEALLPALVGKLNRGGSLAIQMPDNLDEPARRLMYQVAAEAPWADALAQARASRTIRHSAEWYYRVLQDRTARIDIWRTTYHHRLAAGADGVVEWFKGSSLQTFLEPLGEAHRLAYLDRYREAVAQAYPALPDGAVLLPFPRLFIVATR